MEKLRCSSALPNIKYKIEIHRKCVLSIHRDMADNNNLTPPMFPSARLYALSIAMVLSTVITYNLNM